MTVDTASAGDVALPDGMMPWEAPGEDTLGEIKQSEVPTPRLRIIGKEGVFENADTSEKYESLNVILLGLVRQRIFWGKEVAEGEVPLCRSLDAIHGTPNVDDEVPVKKQFPWSKSNFDRKQLPILPDSKTDDTPNGQPVAQCDKCIFAQWDDENDQFPCNEQLVVPCYYEDKSGMWAPGILTFQSSGFKNTTRYLGAMKGRQAPFQSYTKIELEQRTNGDVVYSVPKFIKGDATPGGEPNAQGVPENWAEYYDTFTQVKEFLRRPRVRRGHDDNEATAASTPTGNAANENTGPAEDPNVVDGEIVEDTPAAPPKAAPKKAAPKAEPKPEPEAEPTPEPVAEDIPPATEPADDDDLVF